MGMPEQIRLVSISLNEGQAMLKFEVVRPEEAKQFILVLDEPTAISFREAMTSKPFGNSGEYSYWLQGLSARSYRSSPDHFGPPFRCCVRVKRGRSRMLLQFPCSRREYDEFSVVMKSLPSYVGSPAT